MEARNALDKDFLIFARIDAGALNGDEEVVARAKALVKMGVDVIVPHQRPPQSKYGIRDKAIMKKLFKKIGAPKVWIWGMGPKGTTIKDYEEVGAKMCMPDASPSGAVQKRCLMFTRIYMTTDRPHDMIHRDGRFPINCEDINSGTNWKRNTCLNEPRY